MANKEYMAGFYFQLTFKGEDVAFQEVTGISKELSVEEVVCGGENSFVHRLPTISSYQNLVLKRALIPEGSLLNDWCGSCMNNGLATKITTQDLALSLVDSNGNVYQKWTFHNAYPVKYSVSDFKSQENAIAIESLEFAYTDSNTTPNPKPESSFD